MDAATTIDRALAKGARFEQRPDGQWVASLYKRGRALPLAQLLAPTKDEAAADFLAYVQPKNKRGTTCA